MCVTYRYNRSRAGGSILPSSSPRPTGGTCGDCGGTGDCIHCNGGTYPRRDGTNALCGACHGRGNRKHPYACHACRGKGYGGRRCHLPTYQETVERIESGWQAGGSVDGQPARTRQRGSRVDGLWGGTRGNQPGDGHGHIVSNDGVNADYLRDPGMDHSDYVVNNDDRAVDPYDSRRGKRRPR